MSFLRRVITVTVIGDTLLELDEMFSVSLSNATNATLARPRGIGTILDAEVQLPAIFINDIEVSEYD